MAKEDKAAAASTGVAKREEASPSRDWLARWFDDWRVPRWWPELHLDRMFEGAEPMRVEEFRDGDTLVVKAEMPGIDPDTDVEIDVSDHTLRLRAERRQESRSEEAGRVRSEFSYGSFARQVPLPVGATEDDVKATYKDGILEVRIPIDSGRAEARKIPVQRS
jgi:HSP20 family protein